MSQRQIGRELNLHSSTISREIRRNATADGYDSEQAQTLSDHRRRTATKWTKRLPSMMAAVAGRLRDTGPQAIRLGHAGRASQWLFTGGTTA